MFSFVYKDIDFAHKLDDSTTPSENFERHMHYFNEILYFVKGDVVYHVESESRQLQPGNIVLIPSGKYHFAVCDLQVPYERYVLKFPDTILPPFLAERIRNLHSFHTDTMKYFLNFNCLDDYVQQFQDQDEVYALFMSELIKLLVLLSKESDNAPPTTRQNDIIRSIIDYIDTHLQENITLEMLCDHFHFSKSYLSNCFKKNMKTPIMQYVRSKKIIAAHHMILSGVKKTVAADYFGFDNYSTFYREYTKIIGIGKKKKESV